MEALYLQPTTVESEPSNKYLPLHLPKPLRLLQYLTHQRKTANPLLLDADLKTEGTLDMVATVPVAMVTVDDSLSAFGFAFGGYCVCVLFYYHL